MQFEWLTHLQTPAPTWVKEMGYVCEAISAAARHRRRHRAWAFHLTRCRGLIRKAAAECPGTDRVVVLGSGDLLDIPLVDLTARFKTVELVDIVHLPATRKRLAECANVLLTESDISGVAEAARDFDGDAETPLPTPKPDAGLIAEADLVISANLLSQLPSLPMDALEARAPWSTAEQRQTFGRNVIDHHLAMLEAHTGPVVLITETLRLIHDRGEAIQKADPLFGAAIPYVGEEWAWEMAPRPEISSKFDVLLQIRGVADLNAADQARFCRNTTLAAP